MTVLECGFCNRHIAYLGNTAAQGGVISLGEHERVLCGNCGAVFGDADELFVVEPSIPDDTAGEVEALRAEVARLKGANAKLEDAIVNAISNITRSNYRVALDDLYTALEGGSE